MYRPLAGQLRLLLCDTQRKEDKSLLRAVFPNLKIPAIERIHWSQCSADDIKFQPTPEGTNRYSRMPIEFSVYKNGLAVADLLLQPNTTIDVECSGQVFLATVL